jgi:hypothetical protein
MGSNATGDTQYYAVIIKSGEAALISKHLFTPA